MEAQYQIFLMPKKKLEDEITSLEKTLEEKNKSFLLYSRQCCSL